MSVEGTAQAAMQILLASGEARALATKAMESLADFDFEGASAYLTKAQHTLRDAHRVHTDVIQAEARGEVLQVPALFSHAQDTMMTTESELRTVRRLLPAFKAVAARLEILEHGHARPPGPQHRPDADAEAGA